LAEEEVGEGVPCPHHHPGGRRCCRGRHNIASTSSAGSTTTLESDPDDDFIKTEMDRPPSYNTLVKTTPEGELWVNLEHHLNPASKQNPDASSRKESVISISSDTCLSEQKSDNDLPSYSDAIKNISSSVVTSFSSQ